MTEGHLFRADRSGTEKMSMAKKDRTGNRKTGDRRKQYKVSEFGYYLIVTDIEATERYSFMCIHQALPVDIRNKLVVSNPLQKCF